jgi:hypothetical protein
MKRLLVFAMVLATTLTAAGCSDSTGPAGSLAGTYTLQSVNGVAPPVTVAGIPGSGRTLDVIAATILLDAQGNYTSTTRYRDSYTTPQLTQYDVTIAGYWTLSGNQLALTDTQTGSTIYATVSGNSISFTDDLGLVEVYSK